MWISVGLRILKLPTSNGLRQLKPEHWQKNKAKRQFPGLVPPASARLSGRDVTIVPSRHKAPRIRGVDTTFSVFMQIHGHGNPNGGRLVIRKHNAGASRQRASTPGSRSTASGSSTGTRLHQRARAPAMTTHASTTGSKLTYTLAWDSSPVTLPWARPPETRIDYSYSHLDASAAREAWSKRDSPATRNSPEVNYPARVNNG